MFLVIPDGKLIFYFTWRYVLKNLFFLFIDSDGAVDWKRLPCSEYGLVPVVLVPVSRLLGAALGTTCLHHSQGGCSALLKVCQHWNARGQQS